MVYKVIYADPPWNYTAMSNKIPSRAKGGQPYNAMRMIDIYDFKIPETDKDAVLFMWATAPLLPEALLGSKRIKKQPILIFGVWVRGREVIQSFVY